MDPVTQGALGAVAAKGLPAEAVLSARGLSSRRRAWFSAGLLGALAGMAPDLDVLIRSNADPLLALQYHRHFTHALVFIPLGALICTLALHPLIGRRAGFSAKASYLFCLFGYATHALLDACTTYGTLLLWPFSDVRIAWNMVSVVDPLYTLVVLGLSITAVRRRNAFWARLALAWVLAYPALGYWQRERAEAAGAALAAGRGHEAVAVEAKPSFANLLVWKLIYRHQGQYYVDAVRMGREPVFYPGESLPAFAPERDLPWLQADSQQAKDLARFTWFSDGYLALDPRDPLRVVDMRYSMLPNAAEGLWGIRFDREAGPEAHVRYTVSRERDAEIMVQFARMLRGLPL